MERIVNINIRSMFAKSTCGANSSIKGQMHHHDDLGSKCAYTCHLSNKTTRMSVLLSTPQIWLMTGLSLDMEADIIMAGHILSTTSDWSRDISGRK